MSPDTSLPAVASSHPVATTPSARAGATLFLLAAIAAACSTVAPPVGPYPVGRSQPYPEQGGPRFVSAPPTQCVPYARALSRIDIRGDANTWWRQAADLGYRQSRRPEPGAVMVMQSRGLGHVAVVTRVISDRVVLVDHANWHGRGEVAVGVPVRDLSPDNSWSQVNVWWLDTNQWGAKSYYVEGFILQR
jgi:CHAP domain